VRVDGDSQIYLVASYQADQVRKKLLDLRDLSLVDFDPAKANRLTIHAGNNVTTVALANGAWTLTEPKATPPGFEFDPNQVMATLNGIKGSRATRVVDGVEPTAAGLSKPTLSIDVALTDGSAAHLALGAPIAGPPAGQVHAQGSIDKLVYAVPDAFRTRYERGIEMFRKVVRPPSTGMPQGLENLPPDVRRQIEAQLQQRQQAPH
jgi:hypothetical protein